MQLTCGIMTMDGGEAKSSEVERDESLAERPLLSHPLLGIMSGYSNARAMPFSPASRVLCL